MSSCAPSIKTADATTTCYSKEALITIAKEYNKTHPNDKIKYAGKTKPQLFKEIKAHLSNKCKQEWCWVDQDFMNRNKADKIAKTTFRPKMPTSWKQNKYEWLSTDDINSVMEQYEKLYPDFVFLGAVPIDCPTLSFCQLHNIDLKKMYKNGIRQVGIIFNLDRHNQSGSHWTAFFIDLKKYMDVTYYDSYGQEASAEIKSFANKVMKDIKKIAGLKDFKIKYAYNTKRHQYGYSECGIYSQHYIIQRLKGRSLQDVSHKKIPDKLMNEMRKYLYR